MSIGQCSSVADRRPSPWKPVQEQGTLDTHPLEATGLKQRNTRYICRLNPSMRLRKPSEQLRDQGSCHSSSPRRGAGTDPNISINRAGVANRFTVDQRDNKESTILAHVLSLLSRSDRGSLKEPALNATIIAETSNKLPVVLLVVHDYNGIGHFTPNRLGPCFGSSLPRAHFLTMLMALVNGTHATCRNP